MYLGAVVVVITWYLELQLPVQSKPITTNVVSSNPIQDIQHYVIKFASDGQRTPSDGKSSHCL